MRRAALALLILAGCGPRGVLVAESGHHRLTARDRPSGVTVILTTGAWDGRPAELTEEITVVHALVANMGKEPVLLAPGDIEVRDLRGFRYDLLDPGATFHVAEPASEEQRTASYGRSYRDSYESGASRRVKQIAPNGDVGRSAMPWGELMPGTQMRGYLYFEPLVRTANGATITWHLTTADRRPVADFLFPLFVAK